MGTPRAIERCRIICADSQTTVAGRGNQPHIALRPFTRSDVTSTSTEPRARAEYAPPAPESGYKAAVTASFLGWTLDAFDFFLVTYTLTAIAKDLGVGDKAVVLSLTLTLFMRPVGAFIFGLLADRIGRKKALMANLLFYASAEVATGFAQNYVTFMVLRALFGIGMGGEWGVGSSLAMEQAPQNRRGIISGLLQEGYAFGNLLAAIAYFFVFPHFGWRGMFFLGGIPALVALYTRFYVKESKVWEKRKTRSWGEYTREVASHWKLFLYLFVFMALMNFISHGTQDMYPTFLQRDWGFTPRRVATVSIIANFGAIAGGLLFGHFSDKIGRRRSIIIALCLAVVVTPLWAFAPSLPLLVVGGFLMQFMVQGAWGVIPVHINELAPDSVRGFLPGFAYQCGVAVAGTVAYIEAVFADKMPYSRAMAFTAVTVFVLGAIAAKMGKERHGVAFGE
jgi:SHS family lactate transporter-like MFS transporter